MSGRERGGASGQPLPPQFLPGRHELDAYGNGGFRFGGMSHRGSILATPSGIRAWAPAGMAEVDAAAFAVVLAEAATIELLLLGTGRSLIPLAPDLRALLKEAGIGIDVMPTGPAARTYNVLVAEDRQVAAALIAVD